MAGFAPKLPLEINKKDGAFVLIKNRKEMIQQNLKSLMLTNPGERIMDMQYGAGVRRLLFEQPDAVLGDSFKIIVQNQINLYMPFVVLLSVEALYPKDAASGQIIAIRLRYYISPLDDSDQLILIL
jgi:phage baseplate assembly protein W